MNMDVQSIREAFSKCDVGWVFEGQDDEQVAEEVSRILGEMDALDRHFVSVFGSPLPRPVSQLILSDLVRFKPLVQSFASPMTAEMRVMIYCVLDGARVKTLIFQYESKRSAILKVEIEYDSVGEKRSHHFESDELWDAEVLRHFGFFKLSGAPVIDGYYAFRTSGS